MATGGSVWREVTQVVAACVVVAVIVAVGLTFAVDVTLSSIQNAQSSDRHAHQAAGTKAGSAGGSHRARNSAPVHPSIVLDPASTSASPNEIVHLTGRYRHITVRQRLHVQLLRHHGWVTFPLPAVTDASGRFSAFVELARRGPNRVRMIDRRTGDVSNIATVIVG